MKVGVLVVVDVLKHGNRVEAELAKATAVEAVQSSLKLGYEQGKLSDNTTGLSVRLEDVDHYPQPSHAEALRSFINDIESTGGVTLDSGTGHWRPIADPDWIDLGYSYIKTCEALGHEPLVQTDGEGEQSEPDVPDAD